MPGTDAGHLIVLWLSATPDADTGLDASDADAVSGEFSNGFAVHEHTDAIGARCLDRCEPGDAGGEGEQGHRDEGRDDGVSEVVLGGLGSFSTGLVNVGSVTMAIFMAVLFVFGAYALAGVLFSKP